jgi:hypothetical protein
MAPQIDRAHVVIRGKTLRYKIIPMRVRGAAVQTQHLRLAGTTIILQAQTKTGDFNVMFGIRRGSSGCRGIGGTQWV